MARGPPTDNLHSLSRKFKSLPGVAFFQLDMVDEESFLWIGWYQECCPTIDSWQHPDPGRKSSHFQIAYATPLYATSELEGKRDLRTDMRGKEVGGRC